MRLNITPEELNAPQTDEGKQREKDFYATISEELATDR